MNRTTYSVLAILICAACTFLLRGLPFVLFGGKRGMPEAVRRLADRMPTAIVAVLVVYCLKDVPGGALNNTLASAIAVAAVVLLHLWKRNTLISIAGGTAVYMALLRMLP